MAEFETIEPTELLKRIREGKAPHGDKDALEARNIAYSLRPEIEAIFRGCLTDRLRNESPGAISQEIRVNTAEMVLTALQLAIEHEADELEAFIHPPEEALAK